MKKVHDMKKVPKVIPPPPKAAPQPQPWIPTVTMVPSSPYPVKPLGYGYGPLLVPKPLPIRPKPIPNRPKPSMSPDLLATPNWPWPNETLQDEDKPSCQQGGWNEVDWKEWTNSSDLSQSQWQDWTWEEWTNSSDWSQSQWQDWTLNSWNYKEEWSQWSQDETYQEREESNTSYEKEPYRGDEVPILRSGKRGANLLQEEPSSPSRRRRGGKASWKRKHANARNAKPGDDDDMQVEIGELRFSQLSCAKRFQCGRDVSQLVQDLMDGKVTLSESFLRLTVFETTDETTNKTILRCIDNRRLLALKEYAEKSGQDRMMVNVEFFSQNTLKQCQRFIQNSDDTDGRGIHVRKSHGSHGKGHGKSRRNKHRGQVFSKRSRSDRLRG